jgi:uncharacterized protein (DUF2164 family)
MKLKLSDKKSKKDKSTAIKKYALYALIGITGLLLVLALCLLVNYGNFKNVYDQSIAGKDNFLTAQQKIAAQDFSGAKENISAAKESFTSAQASLNKVKWAKYIPFLGRQLKAIDNTLTAGINIASALEKFSELGAEAFSVLKDKNASYDKISKKDKEKILKKMYESPVDLQSAQKELELAIQAIEAIPNNGLLGVIKNAINPIKENLPILQGVVDKAIPLVEALPSLAGYPEQKNYLFLLENNHELRPTGGFIGTYGILRVNAGEIGEFKTDNIYNLDNPAKEFVSIEPPEPIAQYIKTTQWLMRDSNWSPDFPTSAQKAEEFYHLESQSQENIDGVIAVTPEFIKALIKLTGPIEVSGEEFDDTNLVEKLQDEVGYKYWNKGLDDNTRKEIINTMANVLMERILSLPKEKYADLWLTFVENVDQKQILLYLKDEDLQQYISEANWDGRIKDTEYTGRDYAMVIDANMAALKTDGVMEKDYNYSITEENDELIATLKLHYRNNGVGYGPFPPTTRYLSYTRIYVPRGSELISSDGFLTDSKINGGKPAAALVTQDEEFNKTIFEGFLNVEPQSDLTIELKYKLPQEIKDMVSEDRYILYFQKQPGTVDHVLVINVDLGQSGEKEFTTNLLTDQEFNISLK